MENEQREGANLKTTKDSAKNISNMKEKGRKENNNNNKRNNSNGDKDGIQEWRSSEYKHREVGRERD